MTHPLATERHPLAINMVTPGTRICIERAGSEEYLTILSYQTIDEAEGDVIITVADTEWCGGGFSTTNQRKVTTASIGLTRERSGVWSARAYLDQRRG